MPFGLTGMDCSLSLSITVCFKHNAEQVSFPWRKNSTTLFANYYKCKQRLVFNELTYKVLKLATTCQFLQMCSWTLINSCLLSHFFPHPQPHPSPSPPFSSGCFRRQRMAPGRWFLKSIKNSFQDEAQSELLIYLSPASDF